MYIKFEFDEKSEAGKYFINCAKIRNLSLRGLFVRLFNEISEDQLVLSILDDDSKPSIKAKGEKGFRNKCSVDAN